MHISKLRELLTRVVSYLEQINYESLTNVWDYDLINEEYTKYIDDARFQFRSILYEIEQQEKYLDQLVQEENNKQKDNLG